MGEAIARFREMALAIRRVCDERHSQPRGRAVKPAAAKKFVKECREHYLEHEKAGMNYPARYVRGLCRRRDEAERHPDPPPPGQFDLPLYIEWLPEPFAKKEPSNADMRKAVREAVKEAVRFGELFALVEARIKALDAAAGKLLSYAAPECYENPNEEYWEEDENGFLMGRQPRKHEADRDYTARHEEFAAALEAIDPFIGQAVAADPTPEKTTPAKQPTKRRRNGGGRPETYPEKLCREVVAARKRDEKQAAKGRRPLPPIPTWLREYCDEHNIDIRERFPPAVTGEAWSIRANRFWKAATKRVREAETNRH